MLVNLALGLALEDDGVVGRAAAAVDVHLGHGDELDGAGLLNVGAALALAQSDLRPFSAVGRRAGGATRGGGRGSGGRAERTRGGLADLDSRVGDAEEADVPGKGEARARRG